MNIYIYIFIYIHTHTYMHVSNTKPYLYRLKTKWVPIPLPLPLWLSPRGRVPRPQGSNLGVKEMLHSHWVSPYNPWGPRDGVGHWHAPSRDRSSAGPGAPAVQRLASPEELMLPSRFSVLPASCPGCTHRPAWRPSSSPPATPSPHPSLETNTSSHWGSRLLAYQDRHTAPLSSPQASPGGARRGQGRTAPLSPRNNPAGTQLSLGPPDSDTGPLPRLRKALR